MNYIVYRLWVAGVVRYVGQGLPYRVSDHLREARAQLAGRGDRGCIGRKLYVHLTKALAAGDDYRTEVIATGLTQREALDLEAAEIARWPEEELWNWTKVDWAEHYARLHEDPERQAEYKAQLARIASDPEILARRNASISAAAKARSATAEGRAQIARALHASNASRTENEDYRAKLSAAAVARWADPNYRVKYLEHLAQLNAQRSRDHRA